MKKVVAVVAAALLAAVGCSKQAERKESDTQRRGLLAPVVETGPCAGRVKDNLNRPLNMSAIPKPAPGGSYFDPWFGTKITRVTADDPATETNPTHAIIKPRYSTMRAWNADDSLLLLWHRGNCGTGPLSFSSGKYEIYKGSDPYTRLYTFCAITILPNGDKVYAADIEQVMWDPLDPNVLWYPGGYGEANGKYLMKVTFTRDGGGDITGQTFAVHRDFRSECGGQYLSANPLRLGGDPHDMSFSGQGATDRLIALQCGPTGEGAVRQNILYSITTNTIHGFVPYNGVAPTIAPWAFPSGGGFYHSASKRVLNLAGVQVGSLVMDAIEHAALAATPGGYDTFNALAHKEKTNLPDKYGRVVSHNLSTFVATPIISDLTGWDVGFQNNKGTHISHGASDGSGWIAVGSLGTGLGQIPLDAEMMAVNVFTGEGCRIGHHRTRTLNWGYFAETHPSISRDGRKIVFGSDWGNSNSIGTYVIDLSAAPGPMP